MVVAIELAIVIPSKLAADLIDWQVMLSGHLFLAALFSEVVDASRRLCGDQVQ
jgi:hypothetical protein